MTFVGVETGVVSANTGAVVSKVNGDTASVFETLPALSVTVIVGSLYRPADRGPSVILLFPTNATLVEELIPPP